MLPRGLGSARSMGIVRSPLPRRPLSLDAADHRRHKNRCRGHRLWSHTHRVGTPGSAAGVSIGNSPLSALESQKPTLTRCMNSDATAGHRSWWRPDRPPAHDDLDDAHGGAAAPANECRHRSEGRVVVDRFRRRHIEQGPRFGQTGAALGIGQQSVMANAVEP